MQSLMPSLTVLKVMTLIATAGLLSCSLACSKMQSPESISTAAGERMPAGIIGGAEAKGDEDFSKTIASLYNVVEGGLCTASILSEQILVTAAHCVNGPSSGLRVIFGTDISDTAKRVIRPVVAYEVSPLWAIRSDEQFNAGDIAVVRFAGGLPPGFKPAKVLSNIAALQNGQGVLLAGYGISDGVEKVGSGVLRFVETTIQTVDYSETEVLIDQRKGKGACHGDSGGPAYTKINNEWVLWGVTNRGVNDPKNDCSVSAAYASIPAYKAWIVKTAKKLLAKKPATSIVAPSVAAR